MDFNSIKRSIFSGLIFTLIGLASVTNANAAVSFVSADNNVTLDSTGDDGEGGTVFVFKGLADGESSTLTFSTDSDCPYIAVVGGGKHNFLWSCSGSAISMNVTYKGGLSFGPATPENADSFYVTFGTPPTPPGLDAPPTELRGIQFSLYGDIVSWDVVGGQTSAGASFGIELTGYQGGEAHLIMDLPSAAAGYLGGVLGVTVGGKPNPFADVTANQDGSVTLAVDVEDFQKSNIQRSGSSVGDRKTVKKQFLAGARQLGIAAQKGIVKAGKKLKFAVCAGSSFTAGDKVPVKFTVGGKSNSALKNQNFTLDDEGCGSKTVKIPNGVNGKVVARIKYQTKSASASTQVK